MCFNAKSSIMAWWIMIIVAAFLLWRNEEYDWVIAIILIPVALIQLIEWAVHSGTLPLAKAAKYIYLTLWLQTFIFALVAFLFTSLAVSGLWLIIIFALFLYAISYAFTVDLDTFSIENDNGNLIWQNDGNNILGPLSVIYFMGLLLFFLFMLVYYNFMDAGLWILLLYVLFSALFVWLVSGDRKMGSTWCYLAVGFAFLAWMVGIARTPFPSIKGN